MRKLKLQVQLSVDGYMAGLNGEMDWLVWNWDEELKSYVARLTEPVDCIVLGRKLAEGFIPYWAANKFQEGAEKFNSVKKVVFTHTLPASEWDNTELAKGDLTEEIKRLKAREGGDLIVYGGAAFVSALIQQGLIDEFHLFINPTILGQGLSIFRELGNLQNLTLIKASPFECGIVVLHYELNPN